MSDPKEMPFLDHLEELRWRIIWSAVAIALGTLVGIFATIRFDLIELLTYPLFSILDELSAQDPTFVGMLEAERLVFLNLTEPFFFVLRLGMIFGLIMASPVVAYHVWAFLAPALEDRERRAIVPTFALGAVLFCGGVSLAYFVALPMTIRFLLLFGSEWFTPAITAGSYMSTVVRLLLAFGLAFELPVLLLVLSGLGLASASFLRSKRRHAIVVMAVFAALMSPGDYLTVTILLMVPLLALYELGIALVAGVEKRRGGEPTDVEPVVPVLGVVAAATYRWRVSNKDLLLSGGRSRT